MGEGIAHHLPIYPPTHKRKRKGTQQPSTSRLKRDVAVLLWRVLGALILEHMKALNEARTRIEWFDDLVDITEFSGFERVGKGVAIVLDQLNLFRILIIRGNEVVAEDDVHSAVWPHHCDLGSRIGK